MFLEKTAETRTSSSGAYVLSPTFFFLSPTLANDLEPEHLVVSYKMEEYNCHLKLCGFTSTKTCHSTRSLGGGDQEEKIEAEQLSAALSSTE